MRFASTIAVATLAVAIGVALTPPSFAGPATSSPDQQALLVLNRLGYGPRPGDIDRLKAMGVDRYIDQQLAPERIPESPDLQRRLAALGTLGLSPVELSERYQPRPRRGEKFTPEEQKAMRRSSRIVVREATEARFLRATKSDRQLQEVMTDFWFNHFNIFAGKGLDRLWVGAFEEQAIRPYVLRRFRNLLEATARHPAMLFYLDNWQNTAPNSPGARGKEQGLNENYAREIMELHTLGVDGGYTQQDVIALARIFTGWGLPPGGRRGVTRGGGSNGFYFDPDRHDFSDKVFLGRTIRGQGLAEGEAAMDILARSPATAKHISFQLAQYFVADEPDPRLVDMLAKRFLETDGNIREVLRTLFKSPQFWDPAVEKFKTPFQYVVSAVRLANVPVVNIRPLTGALGQLGMPLYGYLTPDGYKNTKDAWLNPDAMTRRLSFATALGAGRLRIDRHPRVAEDDDPEDGAKPPPVVMAAEPGEPARPLDPNQLIAALGGQIRTKTREAIDAAQPNLKAGLVLGSPEFMNR